MLVFMDIHARIESPTAATRRTSNATRQPLHSVSRQLHTAAALALHPRSAVGWLTRLLVALATLALLAGARPADAAVRPLDTVSFSPIQDPGDTTGNSAVIDPGTIGGNSAVIDPGTIGGNSAVIDPINGGSFSPLQDPGDMTGNSAVVTSEPQTAPIAYLTWLVILLASVAGLTLGQRRRPAA